LKYLKYIYFLIGLAILAMILGEVDLSEVTTMVGRVGWGMALILAIYFAAFLIDSFTWQMALLQVPLNATWLYRTWKARMVGEFFNNTIPAASMGGEPVKATILKKHYGISYREGTASLILGKTINMVSLIIFLVIGFALIWTSPLLAQSHKTLAAIGLGAIMLGTLLMYVVQRFRFFSITGTWLSRTKIGGKVESILHHIHDMDERLIGFYTGHRGRFAAAIFLAFINWLLGAAEVYYAMGFLGHPVSWANAWIIEAAVQLVRSGMFFIPAAIGAQEGIFLIVCTAITGVAPLGVAVAVVRRIREVLWLLWGALIGGLFSLQNPQDVSPSGDEK
jgi:glycosyltransferase 2 family protein